MIISRSAHRSFSGQLPQMMQSSDIVAFYHLVYSGAKATAGASQSKAHPQPQVTVTYVARALACGGTSMDRVFERILTSLMPFLAASGG